MDPRQSGKAILKRLNRGIIRSSHHHSTTTSAAVVTTTTTTTTTTRKASSSSSPGLNCQQQAQLPSKQHHHHQQQHYNPQQRKPHRVNHPCEEYHDELYRRFSSHHGGSIPASRATTLPTVIPSFHTWPSPTTASERPILRPPLVTATSSRPTTRALFSTLASSTTTQASSSSVEAAADATVWENSEKDGSHHAALVAPLDDGHDHHHHHHKKKTRKNKVNNPSRKSHGNDHRKSSTSSSSVRARRSRWVHKERVKKQVHQRYWEDYQWVSYTPHTRDELETWVQQRLLVETRCTVAQIHNVCQRLEQICRRAATTNRPSEEQEQEEQVEEEQTGESSSSTTEDSASSRFHKMSQSLSGPLTFALPALLERASSEPTSHDSLPMFLLNFLLRRNDGGEPKDDSETTTTTTTTTTTVSVNDEWVQLLQTVRHRAMVQTPLFWNKPKQETWMQRQEEHLAKSPDVLHEEARSLAVELQSKLPPKSLRALQQVCRKYLQDSDRWIQQQSHASPGTAAPAATTRTLQEVYERGNSSESSKVVVGGHQHPAQPMIPRRIPKIVYQATKLHYLTVCRPMASFFYVDMATYHPEQDDHWYRTAQLNWEKHSQNIVDVLLRVEQELHASIVEQLQQQQTRRDQQSDGQANEDSSWDDDVNSDENTDEDESPQIADDAFAALQEAAKSAKTKTTKAPTRRRGSHFSFQIRALEETMQDNTEQDVPSHMVLLENLPIDIDIEILDTLYTRCGPLNSIAIYNQRLDLDPGPLTKSQSEARRKRLMRSSRPRRHLLDRPRTPVYALVDFATYEGYQKAVDPALAVFGLIFQKHAIRSVPSHNRLHTLYFEANEPADETVDTPRSAEWLTGFQKEWHDMDLLVSMRSGENPRGRLRSGDLQFPSFAWAWKAFEHTNHNSDSEISSALHWLPTPKDAHEWWTRQRGFD